jgi:Periplasmic binding protein-like domain
MRKPSISLTIGCPFHRSISCRITSRSNSPPSSSTRPPRTAFPRVASRPRRAAPDRRECGLRLICRRRLRRRDRGLRQVQFDLAVPADLASMVGKALQLDSRFVRPGEFREDVAYSAARSPLTQPNRPTGLYVANGLMALRVMRAISDLGLRCPEDVSAASTDNIPGVRGLRLTRTEHPIVDMVNEAVRLLVDRVKNKRDGEGRRVVFLLRLSSEIAARRSRGAEACGLVAHTSPRLSLRGAAQRSNPCSQSFPAG